MLRLVGFGLAAGVLVAACALTEPVAPPGTIPVQLEVANRSPRPAELAVVAPGSGVIPNAAQPPSVAAGTTGEVVFHVPMTGDWEIVVNDASLLIRQDLKGRTGPIRNIGIEIDEQGSIGWWCNGAC
jgi:hypothetical protein